TLGSGSWQGLTELGLSDGAIMIRCDVDTVNATVAIDGSSASLPKTFALKQNYPNPFNPTTTIIFDIAQSGKASLKIYDLTGKEVLSLIDKNMDAGHYQFGLNASNLSSGMYIYRLTSFSNKGKLLFNQSRKLVLMK
ncbi:MAG: T9SS type A sorting domain-containing protein, partial [Candidatus Marinimicrobia bacterium]|nr:T9SS type A sorting domain-containing protein [Candidatus Neomarinimicrobiota bacterium]MBT4177976.1 T9SS type A sorting domain-containing protein [Candidatus Neomarinimicrobiota bacterium]MBT4593942.1 T9SS type A sorting domain-containing protein [Candidatus Neomarinimicrobiota bacterium]MBT4991495.1 T9SS type A sorting domain-containing protein [Candidatus Neomarinimicrobiota bacterium]MBT5355824.1 T9SS type A sorting domain-containing protein [Candidatus Neomarinimicrobiota bacterium]